MLLDPRTLLFAETVTSLITAIGFVMLSRASVIPGARRWIVANLLTAAALILSSIGGLADPPPLTMRITGLLLFVSIVYQTEAILIFSELRYRRALARLYELVGVLALVATSPLHRLAVFVAVLGVFSGLPALIVTWRILVRRMRPLRFSDWFIGFGYGLALVEMVLLVATVPGRGGDGQLLEGPAQSLFYGLSFLAIICVQAGYIVMTKQESDFRLQRLATTDPLSELWNRRTFMEAADAEHQRCRRTDAPLALVLFDLDHFKRINDTHGHAVGDLVIKSFARTVKGALRPYDCVCRYGGEEFLVMLPATAAADAVAIAERILAECRTAPLDLHGNVVRFTASAGIAVGDGSTTLDQLLAGADAALYRAKRAGRDRAELATAGDARASIPA
jgi:diguanylate cyclase (GGDEF)-like protein